MHRITHLHATRLGPLEDVILEPAARTNILTGPNGTGKTALLETAWWALTGDTQPMAQYRRPDARIRARLDGDGQVELEANAGDDHVWHLRAGSGEPPGQPVIMATEDGTSRLWDPLNPMLQGTNRDNRPNWLFTPAELWHGKDGRAEGALRDLLRWETTGRNPREDKPESLKEAGPKAIADRAPYRLRAREAFLRAMGKTLGEDVSFLDAERVPSQVTPAPVLQAGERRIPLAHASGGIRRAISLVHLACWSWEEHMIQANLAGMTPEEALSMGPPLIIMDLPEQGLDLMLQRGLVPGIREAVQDLWEEHPQCLIVTHSPVVLTSVQQDMGWDWEMNAETALIQEPGGTKLLTKEQAAHR